MPYHKRYHGDALTGFMSLTLEERGAYQTILDMIYDRGGPILDNERLLAGYMGCSVRKWRKLRDELIAKRKIRINQDGLLTNSRAEKEIENSAKTSRKLSECGSKGGYKRAENEKIGNENSESSQAPLKPRLSLAQAIPEARDQKEGSDANASGGKPPEIDPVKALFDLGVAMLVEDGKPSSQARSLVGKWRKAVGDEKVRILLMEATNKTDRVAWLEAAVLAGGVALTDHWRAIDEKYPKKAVSSAS